MKIKKIWFIILPVILGGLLGLVTTFWMQERKKKQDIETIIIRDTKKYIDKDSFWHTQEIEYKTTLKKLVNSNDSLSVILAVKSQNVNISSREKIKESISASVDINSNIPIEWHEQTISSIAKKDTIFKVERAYIKDVYFSGYIDKINSKGFAHLNYSDTLTIFEIKDKWRFFHPFKHREKKVDASLSNPNAKILDLRYYKIRGKKKIKIK